MFGWRTTQNRPTTRLAKTFLLTLAMSLAAGLLAAPSASAATSPDKKRCRHDYQYLVRKDGSHFRNAGQCIRYLQSGRTAYWPSVSNTEIIFYGRSGYPNLVTDKDGNVVGGISVSLSGQGSFPPNIAVHIDYAYPSGVHGTINRRTSSSGDFFTQLGGIEVYDASGQLVRYSPNFGSVPALVVPCQALGLNTTNQAQYATVTVRTDHGVVQGGMDFPIPYPVCT